MQLLQIYYCQYLLKLYHILYTIKIKIRNKNKKRNGKEKSNL
jgi:hypothetical protein